jgi:cellulose synthase/poly-beta-1,6-N-acetylglucosamine synthase-like glycosyltransferase
MAFLLYAFLALVSIVWVSSFGYVLLLQLMVRGRHPRPRCPADPPRVAVVIPTLNEAQWIDRKLDNLRGTEYPRDRITVVVVDGGSEDDTIRRIRARIQRGETIRLIEMNHGCGKAAQINRALAQSEEDIVVVTDADAKLEPSCLAYLVGHLQAEPRTGLVGAVVCPQTNLLEERVHWSFLNWIWWLEGEVWSSPGISGVCYALRREAFPPLDERSQGEDVHLALSVAARGYRTRVCPLARVRELRVPRSFPDYLRYRRRRGSRYLAELSESSGGPRTPRGWRTAQLVRRWQMTWLPRLVVLAAVLAAVLAGSSLWPWAVAVPAGLAVSAVPFLLAARRSAWGCREAGLLPWGWAGIRCVGLTLISLLLLEVPLAARTSGPGGP